MEKSCRKSRPKEKIWKTSNLDLKREDMEKSCRKSRPKKRRYGKKVAGNLDLKREDMEKSCRKSRPMKEKSKEG